MVKIQIQNGKKQIVHEVMFSVHVNSGTGQMLGWQAHRDMDQFWIIIWVMLYSVSQNKGSPNKEKY